MPHTFYLCSTWYIRYQRGPLLVAVCMGISPACPMTTVQRKQQSRPLQRACWPSCRQWGWAWPQLSPKSRDWVVGRASQEKRQNTDDSELVYTTANANPHRTHVDFSHYPTTMPYAVGWASHYPTLATFPHKTHGGCWPLVHKASEC